MIIVPIVYSITYNESGILMAFPQNLMKVGVLKFWTIETLGSHNIFQICPIETHM
jgi:hypothetical protein